MASTDNDELHAGFRYGAVLGLMSTLVVFTIVAPVGPGSRAVALALESAALLVVVATSRERRSVRRARMRGLGILGLIGVALVAAGVVPPGVVFALTVLLGLWLLLALGIGLRRLVRLHGVTIQVVAGALGIYLIAGLLFGWLVLFVSEVATPEYFADGDPTAGQSIYYSFTVLTTTGFGDLTPAFPVGRALAVMEMLLGQIYLVTVIGVIIGDWTRSRGSPRPNAAEG